MENERVEQMNEGPAVSGTTIVWYKDPEDPVPPPEGHGIRYAIGNVLMSFATVTYAFARRLKRR